MKCLKMYYALFVLLAFFQLIVVGYGYEAFIGEEINRQLTIHNPAISLTDTLNVEISTQGSINAFFTDTLENRRRVDVRPGKSVTIPVTVIGSFCTDQQCSGILSVTAKSEKTDNEVLKDFDFDVFPAEGEEFIGSAPGLSAFSFITIGLLGSFVFYFTALRSS